MTSAEDHDLPLEPMRLEALDWLVRLKSGRATTADAQALARWRSRSPAHDAAFRDVVMLRQMTLALQTHDASASNVIALPRRHAVSRRGFLAGGGAVAAATAGLALVKPPLGLWPSLAELMSDHRTGAGTRFAFAPAHGVQVDMNTRTSVSMINGGIHIVDGEAYVTTQPSSRPFAVASVLGRAFATRTASFNVRAIDGSFCITCVAGHIEAERDGKRTALAAGQQLTYTGDISRPIPTHIDAKRVLAWRQGLLIFDGTPLSDVLREINRYRTSPILLADRGLGARPVNGLFHTGQIDNTVAQLQQLLQVRLTHLPGGVVLVG